MASSMTKISSVTLSSTTATISFAGIPQTYTDLLIKLSSRTNRSSGVDDDVFITFNGASTTYGYRYLRGNGTTTASGNGANRYAAIANSNGGASANTFANADIYITNYAITSAKSLSSISVSGSNTTENYLVLMGNRWTTTDAITSIDLTSGTGNSFLAYTTATLYGIKNYVQTGTGSKAVGGTVTTSGGYTYHTFFSSGMFTPTAAITGADVLVVAGGGGTGGGVSGGAGAGGLIYASSQSYSSGVAYTAIVGAGGTGGINGGPRSAANGTNSSFGAGTVALGGGAGNGSGQANSGSGGSGGGQSPAGPSAGTGTAGQGSNGGAVGSAYAGGGGGAGAVGGTGGANGRAGDGGVGLATYTAFGAATGTGENSAGTYYYAGGGGGSSWNGVSANNYGGQGGLGGGGQGAGGTPQYASNGLPNTGGGAGGDNGYVFNGGSGIVIVRYTT
jgi:hypothetical protein